MHVAVRPRRKPAVEPIDVLSFPPDAEELRSRHAREARPWRELERRARIARFFGVGMFLVWGADVGAAFEVAHGTGSALFGAASLPLAIAVVIAHVYAQWTLERAARRLADVNRRYSDVTLGEARPLLGIASRDAVIAQYLRCVGRQQRALLRVERAALHAWVSDVRQGAPPTNNGAPPPRSNFPVSG